MLGLGDDSSSTADSDDSSDTLTPLGSQTMILFMIVILKIFAQCFGIDDEGELAKKSTFKLHDAFNYPFQKMMGQGTQIICVVAICDLINSNFLMSKNLQLVIITGFITFVTWVLVGSYLVFHAQNKMEKWYEYERVAHNHKELESLQKRYIKIYSFS